MALTSLEEACLSSLHKVRGEIPRLSLVLCGRSLCPFTQGIGESFKRGTSSHRRNSPKELTHSLAIIKVQLMMSEWCIYSLVYKLVHCDICDISLVHTFLAVLHLIHIIHDKFVQIHESACYFCSHIISALYLHACLIIVG